MGSSTKKTTSNQQTNSNSTLTTTPNAPGFVQGPIENYFGQVGGLISKSWNDPDFLATPANNLQQQAYGTAANLGSGSGYTQSNNLANQVAGAQAPTYTAPQIASTGGVQAASLLDGLENYFNPYLDKVINTTLADYDVNADRTRGDQLAAAARNRGLSGSRFGVGQGVLEGELARGRATTDATLRNAGFDRATTLSGQDADRRQNASTTNAQIAAQAALSQAGLDASAGQFNATSQQGQLDRILNAGGLLSNNAGQASSNARDDLLTQLAVGNNQYGIDKANAGAEIEGLQGLASLLDPALYQALVGQTATGVENGTASGSGTEKTSGGLLGQLGGLVGGLGGLASGLGGMGVKFSDRRLKQDVRRIGITDAGLPIYTYRYKGDDTPQMGVMAQEVEKMQPRALGPEIGGYKTVLYGEVR